MAHLEYFPDSLTALRQELLDNHRDILAQIDMNGDLGKSLGEIGALLDPPVFFDGVYPMDTACKHLLEELKKRSTQKIVTVWTPPGAKVN